MQSQDERPVSSCYECSKAERLGFDFTMAFQPIVNTTTNQIFAYEALVRGFNNEPSAQIFQYVNDSNRYLFDQTCRIKAVKFASKLKIPGFISINFMPNAVYQPELCIRTTIKAAKDHNWPIEQIILEITESEKVQDYDHLHRIVKYYQSCGFKTAIDDFGAGYSGLNFLANIQTDFVKLDMGLLRSIDQDRVRQAIVKGAIQVCRDLSIVPIAEGIETYEELSILQSFGIELFQGYYFAKPALQSLPKVLQFSKESLA